MDEIDIDQPIKLEKKKSSPSKKKERRSSSEQKDVIAIFSSQYLANKHPRMAGKMHCFVYCKTRQPLIVIGPDWAWAVATFIGVNLAMICVIIAPSIQADVYLLFSVGLLLQTIWNVVFIIIFLMNPGLPPRHVNSHAKSYLNRVKTIE